MKSFGGFSRELSVFLEDLGANNNAEWFSNNQSRLTQFCYEPCMIFAACLVERMALDDPTSFNGVDIQASWMDMRRKDVDATTEMESYNPFIHLRFPSSNDATNALGLHLVLSRGGLGIGYGVQQFDRVQMDRFGNALNEIEALDKLMEAVNIAKLAFCFPEKLLSGDVEKDLQNDDRAASFYRQTGLLVRNRNEPYVDAFFDQGCVDMMYDRLRLLLPLGKWLRKYVL